MPFYNAYNSGSPDILPPQMIPLKDKLKDELKWGKKCMDSLETIGRQQWRLNIGLIENYEMIRGRFIFNHYFEAEGYKDMIGALTAEFELPNYLRHYDIISPFINSLSGEWQQRPDLFRVHEFGEQAANEYLRTKNTLTQQFVFSRIDAEINKVLIDKGLDPEKNDFNSPEEKQQYQQQVDEAKKAMTPMEIQKYMDTDFLTKGEIWGQNQLEWDKEKYVLHEKEKVEFEDMLTADRCFRHFYLTPEGYDEETWNPIHVFYHKSSDEIRVQKGDYVGRCFMLNLSDIIDKYGWMMKKDDYDLLSGKDLDDDTKWNDSKYNWIYENYMIPYQGYPAVDIMRRSWNNIDNNIVPPLENDFFQRMGNNQIYRERDGFYFVTEAYWKSQKKLLEITYISEETGNIVTKIVDENYVIPPNFKEYKEVGSNSTEINTYKETWVNEVWKGIKISTGTNTNLRKDLYLGIRPNEFQFKGDLNKYGVKLPVCGRVFSARNSKSMSFVDMLKPYQIGHNVAMNQLYQLMEKEIGIFMVMDVNLFPNSKDWGGENAWDKWMLVAKTLGMLPADTSPGNVKGSLASTGGYLPKIMDLNLAAQMVSRMTIAKFFSDKAMSQIGFNPERLGAASQTDTATGLKMNLQNSYNQTESYFTNFSSYLRDCYEMDLDIAQYVQSQRESFEFTYVKSDMSRAFIKILGSEILLCDLGVRVTNSQETARQLNLMRQYALSNATQNLGGVDVLDIITLNSPKAIRRQLELSQQKQQAQIDRQYDLENRKLDEQGKANAAKLQQDADERQKDRDKDIDVATIKAGTDVITSDGDNQLDTSKQDSLAFNKENAQATNSLKERKQALDQAKAISDSELAVRKLDLEEQKIEADLQIQGEKIQVAKIMKGVVKTPKKK